MRKKKIIINALAGFSLQIAQIIFAFVFPKLVMISYGSNVNGLIQSITQFLSCIALLDAGVSAVIRAELYKPLAALEYEKVQIIINSAKKFYGKIAIVFTTYLVLVAYFLPAITASNFDRVFSGTLVIIIGVSTIAEYFLGISYQVLLDADQRKYIYYFIQAATVVLNTIMSTVLIQMDISIHFVKLFTSCLYIIRPIILGCYCRNYYKFDKINRSCKIIENKWAGLGHHLAYFMHSHTDIIVLTIFKNPIIISVYSVYYMIVNGLVNIINLLTGGIEAAFGNMNAKNEKENIKDALCIYELFIFSITTIVFTTAALTVMPFVTVYTKNVTDANYINNTAAMLLIIAEAIYCIRLPYQSLVMATGKIKETMKGAFIEVVINIGISILLVSKFDISGVALGTICAMVYRTIDYLIFISKNLIPGRIKVFFIRSIIAIGSAIIIIIVCSLLPRNVVENYIDWCVYAMARFLIATGIMVIADLIFWGPEVKRFAGMLVQLIRK